MRRARSSWLGAAVRAAFVAGAACAGSAAFGADPPQGRATQEELAAQVEELARQIEGARNNIDLVEKQYTLRDEVSDDAARLQRFSDAEIQYLLADFNTAAVLFYDLVANKDFQRSPRYADALFYLADSLYQQKNDLGARLYLRQLLNLRAGHYKEALARYLEIAGRLNEFTGIDEYINQARSLSGGQLPPELTYVYAKWLFRREDLSVEERVSRSQAIFATLARDTGGPYHEQAAYFIGVGFVRLRQWEKAAEQFMKVATHDARDEKEKQVRELAELSLGRVYFEMGRYDDAIDHYARVSQQSESFPDSLYEIAWCLRAQGRAARRRRTPPRCCCWSPRTRCSRPKPRSSRARCCRSCRSTKTPSTPTTSVINVYAPVRDEIERAPDDNTDPVAVLRQPLGPKRQDPRRHQAVAGGGAQVGEHA
jgi:tetratricopeptide (TPR) repeat protein